MSTTVCVFGGLCVVLAAVVYWIKTRGKNKTSYVDPMAPHNTVVLHQYGPAPDVPSISPFVMKLETFLRVAKIPYVNKFDRKSGPKGKLPWIQYNDDVISDSQIIIEYLNKEFDVDLNKNLTNEQKALGHVVRRMVEEWLYWVLVMWRMVFEINGTVYRKLGLPNFIIWYMRRASRPRLWSQGIGRHSQPEVADMMAQDLSAIDSILGNRKYLFGETPGDVTEFDCALFGQLCQLTWQMPDCGVEELIQEKYPRLVSFCERMRDAFWPDWGDRLKKPTNISTSNNSTTATTTSASTVLKSPPSKEDDILNTKIKNDNNNSNNNDNNNCNHSNNTNGFTTTRQRQPIEE